MIGCEAELAAREPLFHRPEFGTTRADFESMTTEDFWEVGASGRCYGRAYVLDTLQRRHRQPHDDPWEVSDLQVRALGADVFLATYTLLQGERKTRRSTLWDRSTGQWKAVYHQGTAVHEE